MEELAMKKHITVADLLAVTDVCIEAWARLLESRGKGPLKKKRDDQDVNTTDRGDHGDHRDHRDCGDHGYHRNRQQQSSDQKEKRSFHCPADVEKWCEIHHTTGHNLEECKTFLDRKKMLLPAALVAQEPRRGE
jgi:hypothetical protein